MKHPLEAGMSFMIERAKWVSINLLVLIHTIAFGNWGCDVVPESVAPQNYDTLALDSSTVINNSDSVETSPASQVTVPLGIFFTEDDVKRWRLRAQQGPYKKMGDVVANSPGEWERIVAFKNEFLGSPGKDLVRWPIDQEKTDDIYRHHHELLCAAFFALVSDNQVVANRVAEQLIKQSQMLPVENVYFNKQRGFHTANWLTRLLLSYDFIKGYINEVNRDRLEKWFSGMAHYLKQNVHDNLNNYFPNRLQGDYSVKGGVAKNGKYDAGEYAYVNPEGKGINQIYYIHTQYNNRVASKVKYFGLAGALTKDQELIKHAKIFFKEMLKYGVFPDGTMGEYERNGDYGAPQTGAMYYGAINIETLINLAEAYRRLGDNELYQYKTNDGLWTSKGGDKNLRLLIDTYLDHMTGRKKRYYQSVRKINLIDYEDEDHKHRHIVFEIMFSLANYYYRDANLEAEFRRTSGAMPPYKGSGYWHAVTASWAFAGPTASFPSYAFMFAGS